MTKSRAIGCTQLEQHFVVALLWELGLNLLPKWPWISYFTFLGFNHPCFENGFSNTSLNGHDREIELRERLALVDKLMNVSCISLKNHHTMALTYEREIHQKQG